MVQTLIWTSLLPIIANVSWCGVAAFLFLLVTLNIKSLVRVLVWRGHEGRVRASQLCSEVFSVSARWFTPPTDLIVTVMTVLTLPPASLSPSFSLSFRLSVSFSYFMRLPSIPPSSRIDSAFNISTTSKMHSSKPSLFCMLEAVLHATLTFPPLCLHRCTVFMLSQHSVVTTGGVCRG